MEKYITVLSEEEVEILKNLLGKKVIFFRSPSIDIQFGANRYWFYNPLSILIDHTFLVIQNEWFETKKWEDYWKMTLKVKKEAERIQYKKEKGIRMPAQPLADIHIINSPRITRISVYHRQKEENDEYVAFDKAIVIETEDNGTFCISALQSIADALELTWEVDDINQVINHCIERYRFE